MVKKRLHFEISEDLAKKLDDYANKRFISRNAAMSVILHDFFIIFEECDLK